MATLRLKCKKWQKTLTLVIEDGWTVPKSLLHELKMQKSLEIPIFQFGSRLKIQVDSFRTACPVLKNWMKSVAKQGYIYTFFFLVKKLTTKISPGAVLDYSNKNDNWTITALSFIFLRSQYYFFSRSMN